jgi:hypothetical protein
MSDGSTRLLGHDKDTLAYGLEKAVIVGFNGRVNRAGGKTKQACK